MHADLWIRKAALTFAASFCDFVSAKDYASGRCSIMPA